MTAINILRLKETAHIIADSQLSAAGKPVGHVAKLFPVPHLNAVIATRGRADLLFKVVDLVVPRAKDFADLRRIFVEEFRGRCTKAAMSGSALTGDFDVYVVGNDGQPEAFMLSNHSGHGTEPWAVVDIPYLLVTPPVDEALLPAEGGEPMIALMQICEVQARDEVSVGGTFTFATVRREGIVLEPFARWGEAG
jgi:hypothetical protein